MGQTVELEYFRSMLLLSKLFQQVCQPRCKVYPYVQMDIATFLLPIFGARRHMMAPAPCVILTLHIFPFGIGRRQIGCVMDIITASSSLGQR